MKKVKDQHYIQIDCDEKDIDFVYDAVKKTLHKLPVSFVVSNKIKY